MPDKAHQSSNTGGILKRPGLALALALSLPGCKVGPDMKPVAPPATEGYTGEVLPAQTEAIGVAGGEAQRFQFGRDLSGQWWTLFGCRQLDALIDQAME